MNALSPPPALEAAAVEAAFHAYLSRTLGAEVYESWFARLKIAALRGATAELTLPTKFLVSWIRMHHHDRIRDALDAVAPSIAGFTLAVRSTGFAAVAARAAEEQPLPLAALLPFASPALVSPAAESLPQSPLDPRLTFETFHVGGSNQLAASAARAVAEGATPYVPLCLHGAVGLGKTHLVQALAHAARAGGRRVVYLTAERFLYGFAAALKGLSVHAFARRFADVDVLILDDAQFLQGRSVALELGRVVDALLGEGKTLVVAGDRPPAGLEGLDDRLRSRLAAGLTVEIGPLDESLRANLVEARVAAARVTRPGFDVPSDVVAYVARIIQSNGRDLDGAVNRLLAQASLTGEPPTLASAEVALRDLVRAREPRRVKIEEIQALCARHFNVERRDMLSSRRTANVVRPRQVAMYLAKVTTLRSLPEIGRRFGGRDHTTVLHAVRKIEGLTASDREFGDEVAGLRRMLEDAP